MYLAGLRLKFSKGQLLVPMEHADGSVPGAIEDTLMNPAVVEKALDNAIRELEEHSIETARYEQIPNMLGCAVVPCRLDFTSSS